MSKKFLLLKPNIKDTKTNQYIGGKYQIITEEYSQHNRERIKNLQIIELETEELAHFRPDGFYKIVDNITYYYNSIDPQKVYCLPQKEDNSKNFNETNASKVVQPIEIKLKPTPKSALDEIEENPFHKNFK